MKDKKILSIGIPIYNRKDFLKRLLNSIKCSAKNQNRIEIVIVDDGSTDKLKELVDKFKKKKIKLKYFYQKNRGVAHAMLKAYSLATGDYCLKMDSDDKFLKGSLDKALIELDDFHYNYRKNNKKCCGIIFGTKLQYSKNKIVENKLPKKLRCNFLSLRADLKNLYDCKEIVDRKILKNFQFYIPKKNRVVQQIWLLMAEKYDCITSDTVLAKKNYLNDGLSSNSAINYKVKEAFILEKINRKIKNSKRYKSKIFKLRSIILRQKYALHSKKKIFQSFLDYFCYPISLLFYLYEKKIFEKISINENH